MTSDSANLLEWTIQRLLDGGHDGAPSISGPRSFDDLRFRSSVLDLGFIYGIRVLNQKVTYHQADAPEKTMRMRLHWFADRGEARKACKLLNHLLRKRGAVKLTREREAQYLAAYPKSNMC